MTITFNSSKKDLIGLVDGNNFFVSCERVFRPDLMHKPVIVLSNNDGCVIARSNEVKKMGVPMGAPYYQVKDLLDHHNVTVFSSNFRLYNEFSKRIVQILEAFFPKVEPYSVDEAFVDFSGIDNLFDFAKEIHHTIMKNIGIPVSIGIAPTKTLAKIANQRVKKHAAYNGICVLQDHETLTHALKECRIDDIWGIGKRLSVKLHTLGIHSAFDLKNVDPRWMRQHYTVIGERIVRELNGINCLMVEDIDDPKKSIQVSRSFGKPITTKEDLRRVVATYACRVGEKIRRYGLKSKYIYTSIRTSPFNRNTFYSKGHLITLPHGVDDDIALIQAASKALDFIYKEGLLYKKARVMVMDLHPKQLTQKDLFENDPMEDHFDRHTSHLIDQMNKRFGKGSLYRGSCLHKLAWQDTKGQTSPSYTHNWRELPIAKAI